ncbi:hypothetical protein SDC9_162271 [bioreactor metagenome]|uniref:Uncharacterized protein n=1 Tax=bioreactor metagenome TaxID=1076179 RepID=A0A645FMZ3_9ZZZZ
MPVPGVLAGFLGQAAPGQHAAIDDGGQVQAGDGGHAQHAGQPLGRGQGKGQGQDEQAQAQAPGQQRGAPVQPELALEFGIVLAHACS